jgi:hypothetical protein
VSAWRFNGGNKLPPQRLKPRRHARIRASEGRRATRKARAFIDVAVDTLRADPTLH